MKPITIHKATSLFWILSGLLVTVGCGTKQEPEAEDVFVKKSPEEMKKEIANPAIIRSDPLQLSKEQLSLCKRATVLVGNFEEGDLYATGSGFVTGDGTTIITNKHVVTGSDDDVDDCKVIFFSGTDKPRLVMVNKEAISVYENAKRTDDLYFERDVAVIRIKNKVADPLTLSDGDVISETDPAWAVGFPLGQKIRMDGEELPSPTIHTLRIERLERKGNKIKVLQLGGSPTHGNSGGPVVDAQGRVLGVLQAKAGEDASIVYAVPIAPVKDLLAKSDASSQVAKDWLKPMRPKEATNEKVVAKRVRPEPRPILSGTSALASVTLSEFDLENLSPQVLTMLRNEPFARRGYIFKRNDLLQMFKKFNWYAPRTTNLTAVQAMLTAREKRNVDFIRSYQERNGLKW
ncbi:hypothetical protein BH11ARM2_BH11ARM2_17730 [soil metagenome]